MPTLQRPKLKMVFRHMLSSWNVKIICVVSEMCTFISLVSARQIEKGRSQNHLTHLTRNTFVPDVLKAWKGLSSVRAIYIPELPHCIIHYITLVLPGSKVYIPIKAFKMVNQTKHQIQIVLPVARPSIKSCLEIFLELCITLILASSQNSGERMFVNEICAYNFTEHCNSPTSF